MTKFYAWLKTVFTPFGLLRENFRSLIGFELIYRALALMVFFPLLTWMQRLLLLFNGTNTIAAYNMDSFMRNPLTWVVFGCIGLIMTVFSLFERYALVDALHASKCGRRMTIREIFSTGFDLSVERFRPANWALIPYTLLVLHFGTIYDVSSITSYITVPGYILEDFEKNPWKKTIYYLLIAFMIYLFFRFIYAIPAMLEEDNTSFLMALKKSWRMTRGVYQQIRLVILSLIWILIGFLLLSLTAGVITVVWYLLSLWLQPGATPSPYNFIGKFFVPVYMICSITFTWIINPLLLSSFQAAYYKRKEVLGDPLLPYTEEPHFLRRSRLLRYLVFGGVAVCIFFSGPPRFRQVKWMMNTNYGVPLIMAHRGYSSAAPENTIPAFQKAIDEEITAAELDVQMTKDGQIVVLHDSNLKRTTGVNKNIWEVTWDEIKDLDNGSFFSKKYAGTTIPTLDEVLKLCNNKLFLNIEIKRTGHDDGITQKVIDIILENDFLGQCDITSQDYATIEEVKEINPDILTAYTSIIGIGQIYKLEAADIISIQETSATYKNIENLHNAGKRVFVWTVNEEETMEQLITLNVDAILTNDPKLCKSIIDRYASSAMNFIRRLKYVFEFC